MKTDYPLDMTPADMADELVEYWYLQSTVIELLEMAREAMRSKYRALAVENPKSIEQRYLSMIGVHDDE